MESVQLPEVKRWSVEASEVHLPTAAHHSQRRGDTKKNNVDAAAKPTSKEEEGIAGDWEINPNMDNI